MAANLATIVGDSQASSSANTIKCTSSCGEDQRLSTESKIVSKYCNISLVRPRVKIKADKNETSWYSGPCQEYAFRRRTLFTVTFWVISNSEKRSLQRGKKLPVLCSVCIISVDCRQHRIPETTFFEKHHSQAFPRLRPSLHSFFGFFSYTSWDRRFPNQSKLQKLCWIIIEKNKKIKTK